IKLSVAADFASGHGQTTSGVFLNSAAFSSHNESYKALESLYKKLYEHGKAKLVTDNTWQNLILELYDVREKIQPILIHFSNLGEKASHVEIDSVVSELNQLFVNVLNDEALSTPESTANAIALQSAWSIHLDKDKKSEVLRDHNKSEQEIAGFVVEDPRRILLFIKHTHILDNLFESWDAAYLPLKTAGYAGINKLDELLQGYRKQMFKLSLVERTSKVQNLLTKVRIELDNPELPTFIVGQKRTSTIDFGRSPLSLLSRALERELSYLLELDQVRDDAPFNNGLPVTFGERADEQVAVKYSHVDDQDADKAELQKAIFKDFKETNRPRPGRQDLRDYASLVLETEAKLTTVKRAVIDYLREFKYHVVSNVNYENFVNLDRQDLRAEQVKDKKIESAALILGLIKKFKERHGSADDRKNLADIEDYEAIINALHAVVDRNNEEVHLFQSNRFGKRIGEALGEKPRSRFSDAKRVVLSPNFALEVADYEEALHQKRQAEKFRLFRSDFREAKARFREVASVRAMHNATRHIEQYLNRIAQAKSPNALKEIQNDYCFLLEDLEPGVVKQRLLEQNDPSTKQLIKAYAKKPFVVRRKVVRDLLDFSSKVHLSYINAMRESKEIMSVADLEQNRDKFFASLDSALPQQFDDSKIEEEYQREIDLRKQRFTQAFEKRVTVIRTAEMHCWSAAMERVISPAISEIDVADGPQAIVKALEQAKNSLLDYEVTREGFVFSNKESLVAMLSFIAEERLAVLLKNAVATHEEQALEKIESVTDLQSLADLAAPLYLEIDNISKGSALHPDKAAVITGPCVARLQEKILEKEAVLKAQTALTAVVEKYAGAINTAESAEALKAIVESVDRVLDQSKLPDHPAAKAVVQEQKTLLANQAVERVIALHKPVLNRALGAVKNYKQEMPTMDPVHYELEDAFTSLAAA
ncbi:MAG: hypothetical protein KDH94_03410, partial [Coxiellaceae bacterium]|nr:hypothetical protein [Coxiellaceae bacterium]